MNTIYDVDYFIKKFELTRESDWVVGMQFDMGKHCALGHCMKQEEKDRLKYSSFKNTFNVEWGSETSEGMALSGIFGGPDLVARINNGYNESYPQLTPKQRVLAALYDLKAKQQSEIKERIVYVTVDAPVRELQKADLIEN